MNTFEIKFSKIISWVFHPLLLPLYGTLLYFLIDFDFARLISFQGKIIIISFVAIMTFVFPSLFIWFLYKKKIIQSLEIGTKEERMFPFLITAIFYYAAHFTLKQLNLPSTFLIIFLGSALLIILTLLVNFFWKISIHMIGIGGFTGVLINLNFLLKTNLFYFVLFSIFISGMVGFARLRLAAHTQAQVYAGFFVGFLSFLLLFLFFIL